MAEATITNGQSKGQTNAVDDTYDYIICGGGTSGCVVAGRLAEDANAKVLVLEAGPDSKNLATVHMPGGWSQNFRKETDWNIKGVPQKELNGRQIEHYRGRFLGGTSGVNGALCIRGPKQDYDDWGLEGWSGDEVYKYMEKSEIYCSKPWFTPSPKNHGSTGPLKVSPHDNAGISNLVMESYKEAGLPYEEDMFTTGTTAHGCGHALRTIHEGIRSTAADFITKGYRRDNITIITDATVDKVMLDGEGKNRRATGVDVVTKAGENKTFYATKEIIISGGAYCSPIILMRSGIGAKDELQKIGVDCKVDLPGVGKNLMDHVICFGMFYEVTEPGLTHDAHFYHENGAALKRTIAQYQKDQTGPLACFPFGSFAWARIDDRLEKYPEYANAPREPGRDPMGLALNQPQVEFWNVECYGGVDVFNFPVDTHCFAHVSFLMNPRSRGTVTIQSADPKETPTVDHNYLGDPLDMLVMSEACMFGHEMISKGKATREVIKGPWPRNNPEYDYYNWKTREDWVPFVRRQAGTCYHPSGTCKMGKGDDPMAVLDEKLRVRGVKGLRVADVSVMPILNNGHPQMAAYAIGEKCADMIKAAAKT